MKTEQNTKPISIMFKDIVDFIKNLYPGRDIIPLHEPCFRGNEKKYLEECIDSTYVSSIGKFVDAFERKMEEYTGTKRAVVIVNGTEALHFALKLVGVQPDDEVITQPLTFVATANSISYCNAHPVFIDVDMDTLGLSPDALLGFLQDNAEIKEGECMNKHTHRRIKACVPMHTFGHPCRIDRIVEICNEWKIEVVEDATESLGSFYNGQHTGTFGKIGALSFNGNKIITTGGGGMLLFKDIELANYAKHLSTQAKIPHSWEFSHDAIGYNYRLPNINAALGLAQLEQLPAFLEIKRKTALAYKEFFVNLGIEFVSEPLNCRSNYWLNAILLRDRTERDIFLKFTNENGIMTRPAWQLMNKLPMFEDCQSDELKNSIELANRLVNIPSSIR